MFSMAGKKLYSDFMNEITPDELYEGLLAHGMFGDKIPPIFTSESFYRYCVNQNPSFPSQPKEYIYYEAMRNTNVPRPMGIPNPGAYQLLCKCLSQVWPNLQNYFNTQTGKHSYIISRIHLRKTQKGDSLFQMNYKNWNDDGFPESDLMIGAKYVVCADISNCFPSIYSHALAWALVGKDTAKRTQRNQSIWYNRLDFYTRNIRFGETHGLLIGPHASNLLSEIILTKIDASLYDKGWKFVRNIDDYSCYVHSDEEGQLFLTDLSEQLRLYDLSLNHKKTSIEELPIASTEQWVRRINAFFSLLESSECIRVRFIRAFLDMAIELMHRNKDNAAIINYAMKVLSKKRMTDNARAYYINSVFHLTAIFPYLVRLLDDYVFNAFSVDIKQIEYISELVYNMGIKTRNYEITSYSLYFAIKYGFTINSHSFDNAKNSNDCIFLTLSFLYLQKANDKAGIRIAKDYARLLRDQSMDSFWLFAYEALPMSDLKDYWKPMKRNDVSFIKPI